jgi:hypothetical protein
MRKQQGEWAIVDAKQVAASNRYATAGTLDKIKGELRKIAVNSTGVPLCVALVKVIPVALTAQTVTRVKVAFGGAGAKAENGGAK